MPKSRIVCLVVSSDPLNGCLSTIGTLEFVLQNPIAFFIGTFDVLRSLLCRQNKFTLPFSNMRDSELQLTAKVTRGFSIRT